MKDQQQDDKQGDVQPRPIRVSLELPEDYEHVGIGRRMGRAVMEHCQASANDVDDTEIVIGELCGNAARHARSLCGWYGCTIEHHGDHVIVIVIDQGGGLDPSGVAPVGAARLEEDGSERYGGFGPPLVQGLTDQVEFGRSEPHGTTVRAKKLLQV